MEGQQFGKKPFFSQLLFFVVIVPGLDNQLLIFSQVLTKLKFTTCLGGHRAVDLLPSDANSQHAGRGGAQRLYHLHVLQAQPALHRPPKRVVCLELAEI